MQKEISIQDKLNSTSLSVWHQTLIAYFILCPFSLTISSLSLPHTKKM